MKWADRPGTMNTASKPMSSINLIDGEDFADDHVGHDLDALLLQDVHLVGDDLFGQTVGGYRTQNAASHMGGFEDGDVVTPRGQVAGTGKAGRAGQ